MECAYCARRVRVRVRAELGTLALCELCFGAWARRRGQAFVPQWVNALKPSPHSHATCPFCKATPETIRQTGLYGCCFCYLFFGVPE